MILIDFIKDYKLFMGVEGTEKFYAVYGLDLVIPKYFSNIVDAVEYCTKQGGTC